MDLADAAMRRLEAQRISVTTFTRPAQVVAWLGAVQAQDFLGALWALGLRLVRGREQDVERALADRSIVRTWPMRGTLHFVAAADARWMIELLAPRAVAGAAGRLRALGLDGATFASARRVLLRRLEGSQPVSRPQVYEALERAKISTAGQRGIHILWRLAQDRVICFGPRLGKQQSFVLFDEWVPPTRPFSREEALAELAGRYFNGHGPATTADLAWWSGLTGSEARLAVELADKRLHQETIGGRIHWIAEPDLTPAEPRSRGYLLPAFDEFLVGYADRSAALDPAWTIQVNAGGGILKPTIVVDGRVVGTWRRMLARGEVVFDPIFFASLGKAKSRAVGLALERYAEFLGLRAGEQPRAERDRAVTS